MGKVVSLWDVETGKGLRRFEGHAERVRAVSFSPDGRRVLTGGGREADLGSFSTDNSVRLWDLATAKEIRRFEGHEGYVHTVQFSPDGNRILSAGRDATARVWDVATGRELFVLSDLVYVPPAAAFSPDGCSIVGRTAGTRRVVVWDAETAEEICRIERVGKSFFTSAGFDPGGTQVMTTSTDGTARSWDIRTGRQSHIYTAGSGAINDAVYSPNDERIITGSSDGTVTIWNAQTGEEIRKFQNPRAVWRVRVSDDGMRIFAKWHFDGSGNATPGVSLWSGVTLWDAESGQQIKQFPDDGSTKAVSFTPDGKACLVTEFGKPAALWDTTSGKMIRQYH